jgi:PAS domain-containing protein
MDARGPDRPAVPDAAFDEREYLRSILEAEPACVKVVNRDGTLAAMNPAGLAMLQADSLDEARSRPIIDLIAPAQRNAFLALHQRVIQGEHGTLE